MTAADLRTIADSIKEDSRSIPLAAWAKSAQDNLAGHAEQFQRWASTVEMQLDTQRRLLRLAETLRVGAKFLVVDPKFAEAAAYVVAWECKALASDLEKQRETREAGR